MVKLKYTHLTEKLRHFLSDEKVDKNLKFNIFHVLDTIDNKLIEERLAILHDAKLDEDLAISLMEKIPELLLYSKIEIQKRLSFIYNSRNLYAALFCTENEYNWIKYNETKKQFLERKKITFNTKNINFDEDSIIRNLINATYRSDIIRSASISETDSLETRIYKLKQLKINSNGYRII